ncbi:MAG: DNA mismatch repair endonuclease MutL [Peptococcaceae bacterium]
MGKIKVLDIYTANKIAAGEIIERPVSVVKELLENSLDADADYVEIEIKDGGLNLIRVSDNGHGMDEEDGEIAFERHATSKIHSLNDLHSLVTFGFRGEALPSIAAVSQLVMNTYDGVSETGIRLKLVGGKIQSKEPLGITQGTSVEVWNLFFNTPARRKFIKNHSYESGLITELVTKYSLGHPGIRFKLIKDGEIIYDTAGNESVISRLSNIYGEELGSNFIHIEKQELMPKIFVEGWLARPKYTRNTKSQQTFFINGRLVKSSELNQVLEQSYYTLLSKGRFAIGLINLKIPGIELDVNIHPAKLQVKINNYEKIINLLTDIFKTGLWNTDVIDKKKGTITYADIKPQDELTARVNEIKNEPVYFQDSFSLREEIPQKIPQNSSEIISFQTNNKEEHKEIPSPVIIKEKQAECVKANSFNFYPLGQLNNSFILAQDKRGLYIIDQHTCHERILYEKFMAQEESKEVVSESLLVPVSLVLSGSQEGVLLKNILVLNSLGFIIESFGPRTYILRNKPVGLNIDNIEEFFLDLLEDLGNNTNVSAAKIKETIIIMSSCKGAVKAKQKLSLEEMNYLIAELNKVKNPHSCPHGRPIIHHLSMEELYRIFKRGEYRGD